MISLDKSVNNLNDSLVEIARFELQRTLLDNILKLENKRKNLKKLTKEESETLENLKNEHDKIKERNSNKEEKDDSLKLKSPIKRDTSPLAKSPSMSPTALRLSSIDNNSPLQRRSLSMSPLHFNITPRALSLTPLRNDSSPE